MEPSEPQPYATMDVDQYLYNIQSRQEWFHVGAASFDRQRGLLYVFEPLADVERRHILHAYDVLGRNKTQTAKALGIGLQTLHRKLKAYDVS